MNNYFIQTFNPIKWFEAGYLPEDFDNELEEFKHNGTITLSWSMQSHRIAKDGDISFFLVQGVNPRGIYGAGIIKGDPYEDPNWNGNGRIIHYVDVCVKKFIHYTKPFITLNELQRIDPNYNWSPRSGGITLPLPTGKILAERLHMK